MKNACAVGCDSSPSIPLPGGFHTLCVEREKNEGPSSRSRQFWRVNTTKRQGANPVPPTP